MFREMRRKNQLLKDSESVQILKERTSGVLAVLGDGGYPYAVPLSYVYADGKIYFHCAKEGHKLDAIKRIDKVSFCVVDCDNVVPDEYTTYYRSVIVFGRARILSDDEKRAPLEKLAAKYTPDDAEGRKKEIERFFERVCMIEMKIEHMTGKEAKELVSARS